MLRNMDFEFAVRVSCLSFMSTFRQLSQPKLSIFECVKEQRSDLNNNFWLDFLTARAYVARTRVVYDIHLREFGTYKVN